MADHRHPGGRTCRGYTIMAFFMTLAAMWRHRSELRDMYRETS